MPTTTIEKNEESIAITRKEYNDLLDAKLRFEFLRQTLEDDIFSPPPTNNAKEVIAAFRETGKYSQEFLERLEHGLKRSTHFKHEHSSG